jgi:hypothetical protein
MVMMKKLGTYLGVFGLLAALTILPSGCTTGAAGTDLQNAAAVQLEASLISSLNQLLTYAIYTAMDLPVTGL